MTDEIPPVHDFSRVDGYLRSRQKVAFLHALWRPLLAGAAGAGLIIAAVAVAQPRFVFREIEIPRVTMRDVTVPNIVMKDVEIPVPRIVAASPAPRSPEEKRFVDSEGWREAIIRGRILRPDKNGFILATDAGEESFYPARLGADGKIQLNPASRDIVDPYLGDLAYCRRASTGAYDCTALHEGREVPIPQEPIAAAPRRPA